MNIPLHTLFWKNIKPGQNDNAPNEYANRKNDHQGINITTGLDKLNLHNKNLKILELGCNVGRNLNFLLNNNFKNLSGIEINMNAIELCSIMDRPPK